jgi:hypothetical protein
LNTANPEALHTTKETKEKKPYSLLFKKEARPIDQYRYIQLMLVAVTTTNTINLHGSAVPQGTATIIRK